MGKYWDWYEVEFERIGRKLGPERRMSILESLKEHAEVAQQELMQAGMSQEDAEKAAIKNLGAPSDVIRAETDRPKWQWLPVWVALIGMLWCAAWLVVGSRSLTMSMIVPATLITPIAVLVSTIIGRRTNLWALSAVTLTVAALMVVAVSLTWLDFRSAGGMSMSPRWSVPEAKQMLDIHRKKIVIEMSNLPRLDRAISSGEEQVVRDLIYRPENGFEIKTGSSSTTYYGTFAQVKKSWRLATVKKSYMEMIAEIDRSLASLSDPRAINPMAIISRSSTDTVMIAFAAYSILALAHSLGLAVVAMSKVICRRHWRATVK